MSQPLPFSSVPPKQQKRFHRKYPRPEISCCHTLSLFQQELGATFKQDLTALICEALTGSLKEYLRVYLYNTEDNGSND